jgi:hypothetical protein
MQNIQFELIFVNYTITGNTWFRFIKKNKGITRWFHKLRYNLYIKKLNIFHTTSASSGVHK